VEIAEVDERTASLVAAAMGSDGDLVATRLARGCRCFVASSGREVAGYGWVSTGPEWIGEIQLEIRPREGEGYIWNCVTLPEHRRQGVFSSLLVGICGVARREGLGRLWIGSVAIPAEKAVGPAGFRPALRFEAVNLGSLSWLRVTAAGDPSLAADGCGVLSVGPGMALRRSLRRRH